MVGAKTGVLLDPQAVSITITPIAGNGEAWRYFSISLGAILVGRMNFVGGLDQEPKLEHEDPPEGEQWYGAYLQYDVDLQTQGAGDSMSLCVWMRDFLSDAGPYDEWPVPKVILTSIPSVTFSLGLVGAFRTTRTEENIPVGRENLLGYYDRLTYDMWAVDAGTTWTAVANWGTGSIADSGAFTNPLSEYGDFASQMSLSLIAADADPDTNQVTISNWMYTGVEVPLTPPVTPPYYRPSLGDNPDPDNVGWGRTSSGDNYIHFTDGTLGVVGNMPGWTELAGFGYEVKLPKTVTFTPHTGKFVEGAALPAPVGPGGELVMIDSGYGMEFIGPLIEWTQDPPGVWESSTRPWSGEITETETEKSWCWPWEWQKFQSKTMWASLSSAWKTANAEVPEDGQCPLILHPINVGGLMGDPLVEWPTMLDISHEGPLEVIKPVGISRPADWTGGNGCTPNVGNNDQWDVAGGSSGPYATIDLVNRYITRMERLKAREADTGFEHAFLIKVHRANVDVWDWDPDQWLDPEEDRVPENRWHWQAYGYLELMINAPRTATLTVSVTYSYILSMFDNCKTGHNKRFGIDGEFTYTMNDVTITYDVVVPQTVGPAAFSTVPFDLMIPQTGLPFPKLFLVKRIKVTLPDTAGGSPETWTLDDFRLVDDPDETRRPLYRAGMFDPHDSPSWPGDEEAEPPVPPVVGDYTGVRAHACGYPSWAIEDGTEAHVKSELCWKLRQKSRHANPAITDLLDHAKADNLLAFELNHQEGWRCTSRNMKMSAANRDGAGTRALWTIYGFDARRFKHYYIDAAGATGAPAMAMPVGEGGALQFAEEQHGLAWPGAPITWRWDIVGGTEYRIKIEKFVQGMACGMAAREDRSDRCRSEGNVELYYRKPAGSGGWHLVDHDVPDVHGYWELGPYKTYDHDFQIGGLGQRWTIVHGSSPFEMDNVRFSRLDLVGDLAARYVVDLRRDYVDRCWVAAIDGAGLPFVARFPHCQGPLTDWVEVVSSGTYSQGSIVPLPDGHLVLALHDHGVGHAAIFVSKDDGETWERLSMPHFLDDLELPDHAEMPDTGVLYGVGIDADAVWIEWSDDQGDSKGQFADSSTRKKITDLTLTNGASPASIEVMSDASLMVATVDDDGTKFWCSRDRGEHWEQVL